MTMNRPSVLIVDDDREMLNLLGARLARAGIPADRAASAEEALALMRHNLYEVVIGDIHMPGLGGVEMISALKDISPLVQVVMLTADASIRRVIECVDRGAIDFFSKSDHSDELIAAVKAMLVRAERWKKCLAVQPAASHDGW